MPAASSSWFDPGSATVKTVEALGLVALICTVVIGLSLLVLGGIRCWEASRRRTANRRAVLGLVVVLVGWLLVYVGSGLALTVYRVMFWPLVGVAVVLFCVGSGLGLSGMGQIRRHPKWFNYGHGHAVAAVWGGAAPIAAILVLLGAMVWVYRADWGMMRLVARGYYESEQFGYRVNLSGDLWKRWPEGAGRVGGAEFGVVGLMGDRGLFVLPVWLAGHRDVDMGAFAEALLAEVGHKPGEQRMETVLPPSDAVPDERQFSVFVQQDKGGIAYRYRVAVQGGVGYLIGAWIDQRQGASKERLDEEVMRVSLEGGDTGKASLAVDRAEVVTLHARLFRRMAGYLSRHNMAAEAKIWAGEAQKIDGAAGDAIDIPSSGETLAKAIFALDVGSGSGALELAGAVLRDDPTNHVAMAVRALALGGIGKVGDGLREAAAGLKAAPADPTLAAAADFLRSLKSGDAGAVLGVAVDPVAVPVGLFKVEDPSEGGKAVGVGYDWSVSAIRFRRGEPLVVSRYGRVRMLSQAGAKSFPQIVEEFDSGAELPHLNKAVVLDEKGGEVAKIAVNSWHVEGDGRGGHARLVAGVPDLKPGQSVEWVVTFRGGAPSIRVPFWAHCFSRSLPVRRSVLWVDGDFRSVTASSSTGVPRPIGEPRPHWIVENPPARPASEPYLPPDEVYLPHVWFGEVGKDWRRLTTDYVSLLGQGRSHGDDLRGVAEKVASGSTAIEARVGALARFVQRELKPSREEYGTGKRVPGRPSSILAAHEGDSMGHAAVLHGLLGAAGIDSSLALVSEGGLFHEGIPSLDQFSRMLVFVPGIQQRFVDCCHREGDPMAGFPSRVAARRALVLDPKEPQLVDVPPSPIVATVTVVRRARVGDSGEVDVEEEAQFLGAVPTILAERIGWGAGSTALGKAYLAGAKGVDVKAIGVDGGDGQAPIRVRVSAVCRSRGDGGVRIPALVETLMLDPGSAADRRGPAWIGSPLIVEGRLDVTDRTGQVAVPAPGVRLAGRRLVGCAFSEKGGFAYSIERVPGLMSSENFQRMALEAREVIDAVEPRIGGGAGSGR
ncbi:MAG TPA: hypothetical protein PLU30_25195 [Verrucomicrobiae bacterium]|nr:hypothetical protein [Verrucomicrobiae bacterium]